MRSHKGFTVVEAVFLLIVIGLIAFTVIQITSANKNGKRDQQETSQEATSPEGALKGVSLSPLSYEPGDFTAFFKEAGQFNDTISWAGSWTDIDKTPSPAETVVQQAEPNSYQPMIITSTHAESSGTVQSIEPLTETNKREFIDTLASFAREHAPPFVGIGNEINRVYDANRSGYQTAAEWINEAAGAVKQASPNSQVFVIFQYEQLNGLHGGLFGGTNDESDTDWKLLDDFPSADFIAFTSYPYLIYKDPADIPTDYYSRINGHVDTPVAFTELGWPSGTEAAGWESTPKEQSGFLKRFAELTSDVDLVFATWPFLYDQDFGVPFNSIGLIGSDGQPKPAYQSWKDLEL